MLGGGTIPHYHGCVVTTPARASPQDRPGTLSSPDRQHRSLPLGTQTSPGYLSNDTERCNECSTIGDGSDQISGGTSELQGEGGSVPRARVCGPGCACQSTDVRCKSGSQESKREGPLGTKDPSSARTRCCFIQAARPGPCPTREMTSFPVKRPTVYRRPGMVQPLARRQEWELSIGGEEHQPPLPAPDQTWDKTSQSSQESAEPSRSKFPQTNLTAGWCADRTLCGASPICPAYVSSGALLSCWCSCSSPEHT